MPTASTVRHSVAAGLAAVGWAVAASIGRAPAGSSRVAVVLVAVGVAARVGAAFFQRAGLAHESADRPPDNEVRTAQDKRVRVAAAVYAAAEGLWVGALLSLPWGGFAAVAVVLVVLAALDAAQTAYPFHAARAEPAPRDSLVWTAVFLPSAVALLVALWITAPSTPAPDTGRVGDSVIGSVEPFHLQRWLVPWMAGAVGALITFTGARAQLRRQHGLRATLQSNVDEKNRLLSTMAHEVRTPLTVIQTTTAVLLEERAGPLNARQRTFLGSMHENTHRLIDFTENILAGIKVERGWMPGAAEPLEIRRIVRAVAAAMQSVLESRKQSLRYTFPSLLSKPPGDETWIRHVLMNLVHNASKYAGIGGTIVISVTENDRFVTVTVSDTGHGLVGHSRERLFDEFYQEQPLSEGGGEGSGLGLAIVRAVIQRHGGQVYVSTARGLGTMVSFTLPLSGSSQ